MRPDHRVRWAVRCAIAIGAAVWMQAACEHSTPARVTFSPDGGVARAVIAALDAAKSEVRIAIYAFSREDLAAAVIRAHARGIDVRIKMDRYNAADARSAWPALRKAGVPVAFSTSAGNLHHKFAVIDRELVLTGSYNWLNRAESLNHENLVFLHERDLARAFSAEWERLPADERPPAGEDTVE